MPDARLPTIGVNYLVDRQHTPAGFGIQGNKRAIVGARSRVLHSLASQTRKNALVSGEACNTRGTCRTFTVTLSRVCALLQTELSKSSHFHVPFKNIRLKKMFPAKQKNENSSGCWGSRSRDHKDLLITFGRRGNFYLFLPQRDSVISA